MQEKRPSKEMDIHGGIVTKWSAFQQTMFDDWSWGKNSWIYMLHLCNQRRFVQIFSTQSNSQMALTSLEHVLDPIRNTVITHLRTSQDIPRTLLIYIWSTLWYSHDNSNGTLRSVHQIPPVIHQWSSGGGGSWSRLLKGERKPRPPSQPGAQAIFNTGWHQHVQQGWHDLHMARYNMCGMLYVIHYNSI